MTAVGRQNLTVVLEQARQRIADLEILESMHSRTLEDLRLHQEELRSQNEELRRFQDSLAESNRRYRDLFDYAPVANLLLDQTGAIVEANFAACQMLEEERTSLLRRPFRLYVAQHERDAFDLLRPSINADARVHSFLTTLQGHRGRQIPAQVSLVAEHVNGGTHYRLAAADISERRAAEEQRMLAAIVFEESSEGVVITDSHGRIQRVNRAFTVVTGYMEAEVVGRRPAVLASGRHDRAFYGAMWEQLGSQGNWQGEIWNRRKNGEIYPEWLKINTVFGPQGQVLHYVGIFSDISDMRHGRRDVDHFAFYDMLTDLPNRTLFVERLKHALVRAHRDRKQVALLYLDLDRFKQVNDTLGHQTGDLLLQDVSSRLRHQVRANDTVARLGGDEFTVILSELGEAEDAVESAKHVAGKICDQLALPFVIGGHEIVVGTSVGIAVYPGDGTTYMELVKHADIAMYQAKRDGGGRFALFSADMNAQVQRRASFESALRTAVRRQEFTLAFQPIVDAVEHRVVGVEALLRWSNGDGPVAPLEFIPIVEDLGFGIDLARWVLQTGCEAMRAWPGEAPMPWLSINLSAQTLAHNHIDWILRTLDRFALPANRLVVEVTEEHFRHNPEGISQSLATLRREGVRIALDDFGSGYSSLGRLRHLPIDIIKIDRSFVQGLPSEVKDLAIVATVVTMAKSLGLQYLAEGVENEAQLQALIGQGCRNIQGYVFSRPIGAEAYAAWQQDFGHIPQPAVAPEATS